MCKKVKCSIMILVIAIMMFNTNLVFAAHQGDKLKQPEIGWKRYDDDNEIIIYNDMIPNKNECYYNGTEHYCKPVATANSSIKFNFTGNKLRIISVFHEHSYSDNISISIDGNEFRYYQATDDSFNNYQSIVFEKLDLKEGEHYVEIKPEAGKRYNFDAVDIDENGELKPYNKILENQYVLDIESEKKEYKKNEEIVANVIIDNIKNIAAEDVVIEYDTEKLVFEGFKQVSGIKLVKVVETDEIGKLRVVLASLGENNVANEKKVLLDLKFKGIKEGEALINVVKGKITDGIVMERDLKTEECGEETIIISCIEDVNKSGEFTLLDLGIDARHLGKNPNLEEYDKYNLDIVENNKVDEEDLIEIACQMLSNSEYVFE